MIHVKNLSFRYVNKVVLHDISFVLSENIIVSIVGPNGAGKSTLLKILAGILLPNRGSVYMNNADFTRLSAGERARLVGYLPQEFDTPFAFTVEDVVRMGRFPFQRGMFATSAQDQQIVEQAMQATDVLAFRHRPFNQLSGGEKQRVMLASVLAQEVPILLLDEPTRALDYAHQAQLMRVLQRENREQGKTVVWVTHDVNLALRFSDVIIFLKDGQIVEQGAPREVVRPEILHAVFDVPLSVQQLPNGIPVVYWE